MPKRKKLTRKMKEKKFKTVANWLRSKTEKRRKEEAERLNKEFKSK